MKFFLRFFLLAWVIISCESDADIPSPMPELPAQRAFRMGFTAFPYDLSVEAQAETYDSVARHGDVVLTHLDHGVPWNEALDGSPFPEEVQRTLAEAAATRGAGQKIILTATATNTNRNALASYWNNEGTQQPLPSPWNQRSFDTPEVITAYLNYCQRVIDQVQPDYFAYGIEINASFHNGEPALTQYLTLADTVYTFLKKRYPGLPIFLSFQDQSFDTPPDELREVSRQLLEYSDYVAVSTYPYWQYSEPERAADPALLASDWLEKMRTLAPDKPFAVSETGYCAEDLRMDPVGVNIQGREAWQADYLQKLCTEAQRLDAEFVVWFVFRDYDRLFEKYDDPPLVFNVWKDTGLLDGDGNLRPAYTVWQQWEALPIQ